MSSKCTTTVWTKVRMCLAPSCYAQMLVEHCLHFGKQIGTVYSPLLKILHFFPGQTRHVNSTAFGGSLPLFERIFRLPLCDPDLPLFVQSPSFQSLGVVHTFRLRLGHCLPPLYGSDRNSRDCQNMRYAI